MRLFIAFVASTDETQTFGNTILDVRYTENIGNIRAIERRIEDTLEYPEETVVRIISFQEV